MAAETIEIVEIDLDADIMAREGPLSALQQTLVKRLQQEDRYAPVENILYENSLDIISEIDMSLAKLGIAIIIMTPEAIDTEKNVPVPVFGNTTIVAQVIENPIINRGSTGSMLRGGLVAWWMSEDLKRTSVSGAQIGLESMKQLVNELDGTVLWNVTLKISLNA